MKFFLLIGLILTAQVFGYVDMSDSFNRAKDLNMLQRDYEFAMAILGSISSGIFGLFLWKSL